jgi:O-antigen/teichoic acid export membrane protein
VATTEFQIVEEQSDDGHADGDRPVARGLTLVANALSVMAGKTVTMAFGFLFWLVAAREFPREQVGLAAGVVAAMMLCTQFAIGGVGSALITCYPQYRRRPARLLDTSVTVVVLTALAAAGLFLIAASLGLHQLGVVAANPVYALAFTLMTVFGTVGILLDQLSIALGRGDQVLVRGLAFGVVTVAGIALLPLAFGHPGSLAIFAPWALAGATNVALGLVQLRRMLPDYRYRGRVDRATAKDLMRHGLPNYALTLTERAPGLLLPIIVTEVLTPADNATWYAVWMMAWVVYTIPISAGLSLFAEGSNRPAGLRKATGEAIRVALLVGLAASLVLGLFARPLLSLLGSTYGATGATPLRILLLAFVPLTLVQAYFATSRARRRLREAVVVGSVSAAVSVGVAAAAGAAWGLVGMAFGWLAVQCATGAWAVCRGGSAGAWSPERSRRWLGDAVTAWRTRVGFALRRGRAWSLAAFGHELAPMGAVALALVLWATSLSAIQPARLTGLGFVSVLPIRFYAGVLLLTLAFVWALVRRSPSEPLLLLLVLSLVVMLFALAPLVEDVPRYAVTWRHVGIAQSIVSTGHVDPGVDAYFNWPGFFILVGALAKAAGFNSTLPLTAWSPLYFNLAYLLPLLVIFRALANSRRLTWLSIWIFYLGNWIGQDYFSPQGFSFFLYLVILAILLRWFVPWPDDNPLATGPLLRVRRRRRVVEAPAPCTPRTRRALLVSVVFLFLALVPTHQLTPVAVLLATTGLVVFRACRLRWLPPFMAAAIGCWWMTGARVFFKGHLHTVVNRVGKVDAVVSQNVTNRVVGNLDHRIIVDMTLLAGGTVWLLAGLGAWHLLRENRRYLPAAVLAVAPIPLLILQTYGGEMLLRVQLFALPFTAFFAASFLLGDLRPVYASGGRRALIAGACLLLSGLFLFARYGNEKIDRLSQDEVTAVRHLYALAQPGSILVAGSGNLPWKYRDYASHRYRLVVKMPNWGVTATPWASLAPLLEDVRDTMISSSPPAYLIIERSEKDEVDQLGYGTPGSLDRFELAVASSPRFRTVYRNPDATIFALASAGTAASSNATPDLAASRSPTRRGAGAATPRAGRASRTRTGHLRGAPPRRR